MSTITADDARVTEREFGKAWWLFLATGIAWVLVGFVILAFDPDSVATIGFLTGFVLIAAGVNEFVAIGFTSAWRWLHGLLGALFLIAGIMALLSPFQTFGILALLIGWYLLFKGTLTIVLSLFGRGELPLWGLLLGAGIVEMAIGLWAIGYPGRSAALLLLWVGIGAVARGFTEIVLSFHLHHVRHAAV